MTGPCEETDAEGSTVSPVVGTARTGSAVRKPLVVLIPGPQGDQAVCRTLVPDLVRQRLRSGRDQGIRAVFLGQDVGQSDR